MADSNNLFKKLIPNPLTLLEFLTNSSEKNTPVNLRGYDLSGKDFREANLKDADLRRTILSNANLSGVILRDANLRDADLSDADLSNANLTRTQSLRTNFKSAIFTGSCIEDWKKRVINAVKTGGIAAFEKAINNPARAFLKGAFEGWEKED